MAAAAADDRFFALAEQLFEDIMVADIFISVTALRRSVDVVRFCFDHSAVAAGTTRSRALNSVGARASAAGTYTGIESNWMEMRGLALLRDLGTYAELFDHESPKFRGAYLSACRTASVCCFDGMLKSRRNCDETRYDEYKAMDDEVLGHLGSLIDHADPDIRDAALTAQIDQHIRGTWDSFMDWSLEDDSD